MNVAKLVIDDLRKGLRRILPGLAVIVVVMLLLQGFGGTAHAIKLQLVTFVTSFLGGSEGTFGVLLHTLPLAISAAVAAFAIARRMITFESFDSLFVLAVIFICGATVGGFLRQFAPAHQTSKATTNAPLRSDQLPTQIPVGIPSLASPIGKSKIPAETTNSEFTRTTSSSPNQLNELDWLARPDLSQGQPHDIRPLSVIPKANGSLGVLARATNQLLAYLVAYQPRLFLAAIISGGWIGWLWHQRLKKLTEYAAKHLEDNHQDAVEMRRAA